MWANTCLHIQMILSNISINLELFFWPHGKCSSNIDSPFSSVLVSTALRKNISLVWLGLLFVGACVMHSGFIRAWYEGGWWQRCDWTVRRLKKQNNELKGSKILYGAAGMGFICPPLYHGMFCLSVPKYFAPMASKDKLIKCMTNSHVSIQLSIERKANCCWTLQKRIAD